VFEWGSGNVDHLARHGVSPQEAEPAIADPYALATPAYDVEELRFGLVGETEDGRLLRVIYTWRGDRCRIVTAFPASGAERRQYDERRP
jgi:uncharacterized protein